MYVENLFYIFLVYTTTPTQIIVLKVHISTIGGPITSFLQLIGTVAGEEIRQETSPKTEIERYSSKRDREIKKQILRQI
jgi:hypothetical protein